MKFIKRLSEPEEAIAKDSLSSAQKEARQKRIAEIQAVLRGEDKRKLLLIGPCSAEAEAPVLAYLERLAKLEVELRERFVVVPRIYTGKPRTNGIGYKGLVHRPDPAGEDDIFGGILAMRALHLRVIRETGFFAVDEMLYPETFEYVRDLLAYVAVGARSVENQGHRLLASGLEIPVGLKNPTSGDLNVLLNAIACAQNPQTLAYRGWQVSTDGNAFAHAIVRGYTDHDGQTHGNYDAADLRELLVGYQKRELCTPAVIVDCNHANSGKCFEKQIPIAQTVFRNCREHEDLDRFVRGIMLESYLEDGRQDVAGGEFGKSVTDACLGWEKTEKLLRELMDTCR